MKIFKYETVGADLVSLKISIVKDPKFSDNFTFFMTADDVDRLVRESLDAYAKLKCLEQRKEMQK